MLKTLHVAAERREDMISLSDDDRRVRPTLRWSPCTSRRSAILIEAFVLGSSCTWAHHREVLDGMVCTLTIVPSADGQTFAVLSSDGE